MEHFCFCFSQAEKTSQGMLFPKKAICGISLFLFIQRKQAYFIFSTERESATEVVDTDSVNEVLSSTAADSKASRYAQSSAISDP